MNDQRTSPLIVSLAPPHPDHDDDKGEEEDEYEDDLDDSSE